MEIDDYADKAMETCLPSARNLEYAMSLLSSEVGELMGHWSKAIRDDGGIITPEREQLMLKEAGDIDWGLALLADVMGWKRSVVAQTNLDKLASRAQRGVIGGSGDNR